MCSIEDKLHQDGKLPSYYRRYVDDTFTIMPDTASAEIFLDTLNHCHPSAKFTMEVERNASLPFIGVELLNLAPRIKTKVYVKPTNTGLLLHFQRHILALGGVSRILSSDWKVVGDDVIGSKANVTQEGWSRKWTTQRHDGMTAWRLVTAWVWDYRGCGGIPQWARMRSLDRWHYSKWQP